MSFTTYLVQPCHLDLIAFHRHHETEQEEEVLQRTNRHVSETRLTSKQKSDGGTGSASGRVTARQTHQSFELGEEQIGRA